MAPAGGKEVIRRSTQENGGTQKYEIRKIIIDATCSCDRWLTADDLAGISNTSAPETMTSRRRGRGGGRGSSWRIISFSFSQPPFVISKKESIWWEWRVMSCVIDFRWGFICLLVRWLVCFTGAVCIGDCGNVICWLKFELKRGAGGSFSGDLRS